MSAMRVAEYPRAANSSPAASRSCCLRSRPCSVCWRSSVGSRGSALARLTTTVQPKLDPPVKTTASASRRIRWPCCAGATWLRISGAAQSRLPSAAMAATRDERIATRTRNEKWQNVPLRIEMSECINCDACLRHCPPHFGAIFNHGADVIIVPELCSGCDKCLPACPVDCIYPDPDWQSTTRPRRLVGRTERPGRPLPVACWHEHACRPARSPTAVARGIDAHRRARPPRLHRQPVVDARRRRSDGGARTPRGDATAARPRHHGRGHGHHAVGRLDRRGSCCARAARGPGRRDRGGRAQHGRIADAVVGVRTARCRRAGVHQSGDDAAGVAPCST